MLLLQTGKQSLLSALRTAVAVAAQEASPLQWVSVGEKNPKIVRKNQDFQAKNIFSYFYTYNTSYLHHIDDAEY